MAGSQTLKVSWAGAGRRSRTQVCMLMMERRPGGEGRVAGYVVSGCRADWVKGSCHVVVAEMCRIRGTLEAQSRRHLREHPEKHLRHHPGRHPMRHRISEVLEVSEVSDARG